MGSAAGAFGPPAVVVSDGAVEAASFARGARELSVELEGVAVEAVAWELAATASAGWSVEADTARVDLASATGAKVPLARIGLRATALDPECPPAGLVVQLDLTDPTGRHGAVPERLYYPYGVDGLVPSSYEAYLADFEAIDAGRSRLEGCAAAVGSVAAKALAPSVLAAEAAASPMAVTTVTRTFTGRVVFWDSRGNRSDAYGSRLPTCNAGNTTCTPGSAGCCWRPVPQVRAVVAGLGQNQEVGSVEVNPDGSFSITATGQPPGGDYHVKVVSRNNVTSANPPRAHVEVVDSASTAFMVQSAWKYSSTGALDFGTVQVNAAGDTTSSVGDGFTAYVAAIEAFGFLSQEGEVRHHHLNPPASPLTFTIRLSSGSNNSDCDAHTTYVSPSYARSLDLVHLLGFQYLGAVVGCSGDEPAYPAHLLGGYDPYTAEGNALRVGIPSLLVTLSRFDPEQASTNSIFGSLYPCRVNGYQNANNASDERNNWHGLWELVDASTANTSGQGTDFVNGTVAEVLDAVFALQYATTSAFAPNFTNYEQVLTEDPSSICFSSEHCSAGAACIGYICYTGDPHGENIYDVAYWMAQADTSGLSRIHYYSTLASSPCLGYSDNVYPFTGGFHTD